MKEYRGLYKDYPLIGKETYFDHLMSSLVDEKHETALIFAISFIAATTGTFISAPFNYTRNHMFGTKPGERIPTSREILRDLWKDAHTQHEMNVIRYISMRFRLAAATSRVGCGMAVGQWIYDGTKKHFFQLSSEEEV